MTHITENHEALLDYIYEEGDPAERLKMSRHLQNCAECSVAVLEMQAVRGILREWTPPALAVSEDGGSERTRPTPVGRVLSDPARRWTPSWLQAAAAVFLVALGMGLSQLRVEMANGALTVRAHDAESQVADVVPTVDGSSMPLVHTGTDVLLPPESFQTVSYPVIGSGEASAPPVSSPATRAAADDVLRRVKALIDQSETRQQRELALRLAEVVRDFDTQRQADMRRVDQNLGQVEAQTGAEVARQRELTNALVKVSQGGAR